MDHATAAPDDIANTASLRQLLAWVAERPRTYAEAMEAWRTSCPRLCPWEDATRAGMVALKPAPGRPHNETAVVLTADGRQMLDASV